MWTYEWYYSKPNAEGCYGAIGSMYKDGQWQATFRYKVCGEGNNRVSTFISSSIHHECTEVHG